MWSLRWLSASLRALSLASGQRCRPMASLSPCLQSTRLRMPKNISRKDMAGKTIDESDVQAINMDALIDAEVKEREVQEEESKLTFQRFPDDRVIESANLAKLVVVTIVLTRNNTKIAADDCDGKRIAYTSPREHGFLHAKKRSPIAAQTAGMAMGQMLRNRNIRNVRVRLDGFNQGRIAVLQGIVQAGINVVAISDATPVHFDWPLRPKKKPRVN